MSKRDQIWQEKRRQRENKTREFALSQAGPLVDIHKAEFEPQRKRNNRDDLFGRSEQPQQQSSEPAFPQPNARLELFKDSNQQNANYQRPAVESYTPVSVPSGITKPDERAFGNNNNNFNNQYNQMQQDHMQPPPSQQQSFSNNPQSRENMGVFDNNNNFRNKGGNSIESN